MRSAPILLLLMLIGGVIADAQVASPPKNQSTAEDPKPIPTVDFCEMVTHPEKYFDHTIRLTTTMEMKYEQSNLNNVRCVRSHDDSIGVGSVKTNDKQIQLLNQSYSSIRSGKFGMQPHVTVVGILRNESLRAFAWYRYRFDIIQFENIRQEISETIAYFDGSLHAGQTYRARVRRDKDFDLTFAFFPIRVPIHQAARLEWINLKDFPALQQLGDRDEKQIIFRVIKDDVQQMGAQRWDRTLKLEILLVE